MTAIRRASAALALALPVMLAVPWTPAGAAAAPSDPWVRAWGLNNTGQLGNGSTLDQQTPSTVTGLARADVRELAAGGWNSPTSFAVTLLNDGTVQSWGGNTNGQLGDGTTTARSFPAAVSGLSGVTEVAAGATFAYAVRGGRLLAWGDNTFGQLGNGVTAASTDPPAGRPVSVQSLNKVKDIAAGCSHALALREDGSVWTWGRNHFGQLGLGSTTDRNTPRRVPDLMDVVEVAAGCHHSLVRTSDGTVKAWGYNTNGQLGNDSNEHGSAPVDVKHLTDVARIYAAGYHSFAVLDDGQVRAWGWNGAGHLGDGSTVSRTTPVPVPGLTDVTALAGGYNHTLAVLADGSVLAWGDNTSGKLGDGTTTNSPTPVTVLRPGSGTTRVAASKVSGASYAY
ncbi:RCC1 domain-containing protein [Streptomyces sp. NPDC056480]|uniref:RCC1 domain-containing protein n=1 Tax=Streptomyces sp. NPDC056480 TaxID=3345833 RepID=UPI003678C51B